MDDHIPRNDSETDALKTLFERRTATVTKEMRSAAKLQTQLVTAAWFI